jgi:propanol-preferring alcohol dehydrogenase
MTTYQVIEVSPDRTLVPAERELVEPSPGEVRIRVEACGICHTDLSSLGDPGRVPGHEIVGRIDAVGAGVTRWSVGDRVGVGFLGGHCGECEPCRRGEFVNCEAQPKTGMTTDGGYAEYLYARQSGLVAIPAALTATAAAPLLCAGFTTYNALLKTGVRHGALVAVQGIGGLGHLGIQYARALGARVAAIARGSGKEHLAKQLGADHYIDSTATDPGAALRDLGGAAVILATAASGPSMTPLVTGLAYGGQLMVVGASADPIEVTPMSLIFGGTRLAGSLTGTSIENEDNLTFAEHQHIAAMIEEAPLSKAATAFDRMRAGEARFRMVLTMA